ncbi:hypothetical protein CPAR01_15047 [Colletotrichum paranaense]|uniref:Secreted protein n=1 Tax=Colletotrichum paranaense TaxID=1914294 RepID=A0ABQ9S0N4_9PEZI|nr:uncharacterized protein CPAR01_15047 [Colletotrichum paranaense]KAK1521524.1 hypothetical protein CPAR01_15047 [Colletotrichum paranaense]
MYRSFSATVQRGRRVSVRVLCTLAASAWFVSSSRVNFSYSFNLVESSSDSGSLLASWFGCLCQGWRVYCIVCDSSVLGRFLGPQCSILANGILLAPPLPERQACIHHPLWLSLARRFV